MFSIVADPYFSSLKIPSVGEIGETFTSSRKPFSCRYSRLPDSSCFPITQTPPKQNLFFEPFFGRQSSLVDSFPSF